MPNPMLEALKRCTREYAHFFQGFFDTLVFVAIVVIVTVIAFSL